MVLSAAFRCIFLHITLVNGWLICASCAFTARSARTSFLGDTKTVLRLAPLYVAQRNEMLTMRDTSASYWFQIGDRVQVVESVLKGSGPNAVNLRGRRGVVVETWEKCDVDPTCCCAEQVDTGMAVRVEFCNTSTDEFVEDKDDSKMRSKILHYFAEAELVKIAADNDPTDKPAESISDSSQLPNAFDGMSCTAFKLQQLQVGGSKPRSIASFDPNAGD